MSFITFNNLSRFEQGIKNILSQVLGGLSSTVGNSTLNTAAQNLTGAINEHEVDIGDMALSTVATDLTGAINEMHNVPLDIQELYKPLIAPRSALLTGFVEGSYLRYGIFDDELRVFVKVSKSTTMAGAVGTLPAGYRPAETQQLSAYYEDGNISIRTMVRITPIGEVAVMGDEDANVIIFASYKGE